MGLVGRQGLRASPVSPWPGPLLPPPEQTHLGNMCGQYCVSLAAGAKKFPEMGFL